MSITLPKLPHPVMNAMLGDDWADLFTADQMHAHATAVSAAKDKEIAALRERVAALDDDREAMYKALVDLDELHTKAAEITLAAIRPQGVEVIDAARAKVCADYGNQFDAHRQASYFCAANIRALEVRHHE